MICCFVLFLYACGSMGYGFDSGGDQAACGRPYRSGRIYQPPCDLEKQGFCTSAGRTYPWHAVKRFVRDNQGLMRRMYGDQRHGHILRAELQDDVELWNTVDESSSPPRYSRYQHQEDLDNDLIPHDDVNREGTEARFLHDDVANEDVLNTKFVYSEEPTLSIKLAGLKTAPHFRPTTQSTPKTTSQMNSAEELTETITEAMDINTTTDTTTDQTTSIRSNDVANDRLDEVATYPTTDRNNLFIEIETDNNEDKTETMLFQDVEDDVSKKKPVNYNMRGVNACPVKEEVVAPFWANNTRGEILALLNMYPFEQYVHWEKCTFEHRQMYCREGCRCEQQYRLHRLLAYDPNNECRGIFSDWFRFPSCCVCKCYDLPLEFRVTSRSPRFRTDFPEK